MVDKYAFDKPEDRVFLTVDFNFQDGFTNLFRLTEDFGQEAHAVKVGQGFLLQEKWPQMLSWLRTANVQKYLDLKSHEDPDQMSYNTSRVASLGFEYMSVHASATPESLEAAVKSAGEMVIVAAFSYAPDGLLLPDEQANVEKANQKLPKSQQIGALMVNACQIESTHQLGDSMLRIATGIRRDGDELYDQPAVATPGEAVRKGAHMLAIGRTLTAAQDQAKAWTQILESIEQGLAA
jgi:orotidine-5'-phosphate decarboxylase